MKKPLVAVTESLDRHVELGATVLLALSGGVDSVCLLQLVSRTRPDINLHAVHLNHQLRREADKDEAFCRDLCENMKVTFHSRVVDVGKYCVAHKLSIETGAREVRHGLFTAVRAAIGADTVLLGHHANDRAETLLHNLLRGSGIHGLGALPEWNGGSHYLRPLIGVEKYDIIDLARAEKWDWVQDATNDDVDFDRNWLRNEVIPGIEKRRPAAGRTLAQTAETLEQVSDYMKQQAREFIAGNISASSDVDRTTFFDIDTFRRCHRALQSEVILCLWKAVHGSGAGFSRKRVEEVQNWMTEDLRNGSVCYFGPSVTLCNRNGAIGIKSKTIDLIKIIELFAPDKHSDATLQLT